MKKKIVIFSGAGLDRESGILTFRDCEDGLWNNYKLEDVCTPEAWNANPTLVNDFYNMRRIEMLNAVPNQAHYDLAKLEEEFDVVHITQNVSDLLERAGCTKVVHLHGELLKARSSDPKMDLHGDSRRVGSIQYRQYPVGREGLNMGTVAEDGFPLRPDIVFFGESLPQYPTAVYHISQADAVIVVGTSLQVAPASSLPGYITDHRAIWYVDPGYKIEEIYNFPVKPILAKATVGIPIAIKQVREYINAEE
jgi:NAD-dependent deacetylase